MFDLIILNRYFDDLTSCDLQFGSKENRSTDVCTMVLRESVSYYVNNGSSVFCTFLDASKAFDRVAYCQLFRLLMRGPDWCGMVFILPCLVSPMESSRVGLPVPLCFAFTSMSCY